MATIIGIGGSKSGGGHDATKLDVNLSNIDESICKTQLLDKGLREYRKPLEALYDQ